MQKNGHIRIPNDVWEALIRCRLPSREMQVLMFIIRKTIGWNKQFDEIALSQFIESTHMAKSSVCRAINKLKKKNIVFVDKNVNRTYSRYQFNMKFKSWEALTTVSIVDKNETKSLTKMRLTINTITKDKETKAKKKEKLLMQNRFNRFYKAYPKKVGKAQALKTWEKLTRTKKLPQIRILIQSVRKQLKSSQWKNKKYIPNPSTWLNNERWEDEIIFDTKSKISSRDFSEKNKRNGDIGKTETQYSL